MNPAFRFLLAATGISLLSMVDHALADSVGDSAEAAAKVILEAGEIDSSTVPAGSYVVVIHGQGERHPVSEEWEQLVTSRGYVHAVDAKVLTLFRGWDDEPEWIAVDRIQTLVLMGSPSRELEAVDGMGPADPASSKAKSSPLGKGNGDSTRTGVEKKGTAKVSAPSVREARDSTQVDSGRARRNLGETRKTLLRTKRAEGMGVSRRLEKKVAAGALGALVGGLSGVGVGITLVPKEECESGDTFCGLGTVLSGLFFGTIGITFGTAVGVTRVDPHDQFGMVLIGSTVGMGAGWLTARHTYGLSLLAFPVVLAVTMSEKSRKPPDSSRFSFGLRPGPEKGLSAVASLRF